MTDSTQGKTIMINSDDAAEDKRNLVDCRVHLYDAKTKLQALQNGMGQHWKSEAMVRCYDLISDFVKQTDSLINRDDTTVSDINTIVSIYSDADEALKSSFSGGGSRG